MRQSSRFKYVIDFIFKIRKNCVDIQSEACGFGLNILTQKSGI